MASRKKRPPEPQWREDWPVDGSKAYRIYVDFTQNVYEVTKMQPLTEPQLQALSLHERRIQFEIAHTRRVRMFGNPKTVRSGFGSPNQDQ